MQKKETITLADGNGGAQMRTLLHDCIFAALGNDYLAEEADGALVPREEGTPVLTTDGYTVHPLFFPGGDIGHLAVCGTVNDLVVMGATPTALTLGVIIEAGTSTALLQRVMESVRATADTVGVPVVAGDTKVVEQGAADTLFLTTSGLGWKRQSAPTGWRDIVAGDDVILSGTPGHHGIALLAAREELPFTSELVSDAAPLDTLLLPLFAAFPTVRWVRDATRGGVAAVLNELAQRTHLCVEVREDAIPSAADVHGAAEILGLDPLYLANEGRCVLVVPADITADVLAYLHAHPLGTHAARIGTLTASSSEGDVVLHTRAGGCRRIPMPSGEHMPRIC